VEYDGPRRAAKCGGKTQLTVISPLHAALDEYLALRRALGHELRLAGHRLQQFLAFAGQAGATYITTDLELAWATLPASTQPAEWARRLGIARRFAEYCAGGKTAGS